MANDYDSPSRCRRRGARAASFPSAGVVLALGTCLAFFTFLAWAAAPRSARAAESSLAALVTELKDAIRAKKVPDQLRVASQIAALGEPKGFEALAQLALTGETYVLEQHVARLVAETRDGPSRAAVLGLLDAKRSPNPKTRILLLGIAEKLAADPVAGADPIGAIGAALGDSQRAVVLTALEAARHVKSPESLGALVKLLEARERRPRDRVYFDVLRSLREVTGLDLQASVDWKNYAEAVRTGQAPAVRSGGGEGVTEVFRGPSFFSVNVDSDAVLFVIDISGSMTKEDAPLDPSATAQAEGEEDEEEEQATGVTVVVGPKGKKGTGKKAAAPRTPPASRVRIERVKAELIRVLRSIPESTRFGILAFNHQLVWFGQPKGMQVASRPKKAEAEAWVKALVAEGATRTDLALADALATPDVDTIYVLTDGAPQDELSQKIDIEQILAYTRFINRFLRCRIHTISFAQIRDTKMRRIVRELAVQNDGASVLLP